MLIVALLLPLLAAGAAWQLDRLVPTRHIGYVAIGTLFLSAMTLMTAGLALGLPLQMLAIPWIKIDDLQVMLTLRFDPLSWSIACVVLFSSAVGMVGLIHSLPYNLRNYGRLISLLLLHIVIIVVGIAAQDVMLRVFAWGIAAIVGGLLMRLSGALPGSNSPLISVVGGISGAILLMVAVLWRQYLPAGQLPTALVLCWSFAAFVAMGLMPFHGYIANLSSAPAILTVFMVPLGTPLLGLLIFSDFMLTQSPLISASANTILTGIAIVSAIGCAAGALGADRLRTMLGWHTSSQFALVVLFALSDTRILVIGVPLLLVSGIISTIMIALAIAFIEVRSNTDEISQLRPHANIGLAGVIILIAVATAIGLPGTVGFIVRWWIAEVIFTKAPWILIAMLVAGSLLGLAWSVVLATIWRRSPRTLRSTPAAVSSIPNWGAWLGSTIFAAFLLILGVFPNVVWETWGVTIQSHFAIDTVISPPTMPTILQQTGLALMALFLVIVPLVAGYTSQRSQLDANDQQAVTITPIATAESLSLLTSIVKADGILGVLWQAMIRIGLAIQWILRLGEERYYVAGLILGLIVIVLLLI